MTLPFKMTICGISELGLHSDTNVTHVLSILDPEWPVPEAFGAYGEHVKLELRFHDVIEDEAEELPPQPAQVAQLLEFGRSLDAEPRPHLLVHCHAGVSRSSASLALLVAQAAPERPAETIFADILAIRPQIWPNLRIIEIGDAMLQRNGTLLQAVAGIYRHQITKDPLLAKEFRAGGRGREVDLGLKPER